MNAEEPKPEPPTIVEEHNLLRPLDVVLPVITIIEDNTNRPLETEENHQC